MFRVWFFGFYLRFQHGAYRCIDIDRETYRVGTFQQSKGQVVVEVSMAQTKGCGEASHHTNEPCSEMVKWRPRLPPSFLAVGISQLGIFPHCRFCHTANFGSFFLYILPNKEVPLWEVRSAGFNLQASIFFVLASVLPYLLFETPSNLL